MTAAPAGRLPRREAALAALFAGLPVASLAFALLCWLSFGLDFPTHDDWRGFIGARADSLRLSWLFTSANDTLYPVGKVLDSLAQRTLKSNAVAYQFLSMLAVQGGLLALTWLLVRRSLGDAFLAACCLSAALLMLQPGSYWGWQNMAYHQALPLLFLLAALHLAAFGGWRPLPTALATFALGLLAGLTYISGAFGGLAMGLAMLVHRALCRDFRSAAFAGALGLVAAGLATGAAQLRVILVVQRGGTHIREVPVGTPLDADFWLYLLGKIGRALMLPADAPALSLAITLAVAALVLWGALAFLMRLVRERGGEAARPGHDFVFLAVVAMTGAYLLMVAAGRAGYRGESVDTPLEVFSFGFLRFHFFWVSVFWPFAIASLVAVLRGARGEAFARHAAAAVAGVAIALAVSQGALRHDKYFEGVSAYRTGVQLRCLATQLAGSGGGIDCPMIHPGDLAGAYAYAVSERVSFTRYFPPDLLRFRPSPDPFADIAWTALPRLDFVNADPAGISAGSLAISTRTDAQVIFSTGGARDWKRCAVLELAAEVRAQKTDSAELFFLPAGQADFAAGFSARQPLGPPGGFVPVNLVVLSHRGFEDRFRLDPVNGGGQTAEVRGLRMRCLLPSG